MGSEEVEVEAEKGRTLRRWCSSRGSRGSGREGSSLIGEWSRYPGVVLLVMSGFPRPPVVMREHGKLAAAGDGFSVLVSRCELLEVVFAATNDLSMKTVLDPLDEALSLIPLEAQQVATCIMCNLLASFFVLESLLL